MAGEEFQTVFVSRVSFWFTLRRLHVFNLGGDCFGNCVPCATADFSHGFDARAVRLKLDGFATCTVENLRVIFDLFTFSAVLPPLDVIEFLRMNFDFSTHTNLVAEFTVRLHNR
ncbi:MAG: hypothetical protein WCE52_13115, partial [Candidatus Acidiferrum sp.]